MTEIVNGASINKTHANVHRSRSKFNEKQRIMDTYRFGEYHPHFVFDGITSDKLLMRSMHNARSYTLKAPLMQDIQMHKDYFAVTLRSILPFQSERIITNPTLGDDVPFDAYTFVNDFISKIRSVDYGFVLTLSGFDLTDAGVTEQDYRDFLCFYLKRMIFLESVFSNGSLLASLGCNIHENLSIACSGSGIGDFMLLLNPVSIDVYLDTLIGAILSAESGNYYVTIDGTDYIVKTINVRKNNINDISWHEFLVRIRDTSDWSFKSTQNFSASLKAFLVKLYTDVAQTKVSFNFVNPNLGIDLARVWAYHLCQAEFYTNDKVDYIYNADLFRQYIHSLVSDIVRTFLGFDSFSWNGASLPYDYLSAFFFNSSVSALNDTFFLTDSEGLPFLQYLYTLFGYHRSLRFKDYFTGSRTRPLAVGDVNAPVVSNQVSVIDVSRKIQLQRYLNAVNSTGRKFEEYLKGIFGEAPSPDHHNPLFLAHTSDNIFAAEVENTGDAQWDASSETGKNSVTAVFRGNSNKFAFQFDVKEPCIILGITSFDIERSYPTTIERSFFTKDRFDMFIPELQYVGDQMVYRAELNGTHTNPMNAFGYQFRDMDRKQLINRAQGGFSAGSLPGYAFLYRSAGDAAIVISPNFIRSICSELDDFYLSLTGYSLGTYFHFIVSNDNIVEASRPMAVNPQILG